MAEEEVGLRLSLKNRREVASGVHQVGTELDRVGDQAADVNRQSRIASRGIAAFGRAGRTAGKVAALGIGAASAAVVAAGYAATKVVKASLSEAREAQKVSAVTRAEIKATGGVANVTAKSMSRLAGAISRKVGIDDEAIQSGANLLLTFKNIRNEQGKGNKIFNLATKAAVNLAAAGFGSIQSGSKMLGKALNDPIKGITALGRAGVTFSAQQIDTIKGMVEQNNLLGAQKIILGEVKSQVGGVAAEQATWGDKAGVLFGNMEEKFGTGLLPLFDSLNRWFVRDGGPALEHYVGLFNRKGVPAIKNFIDQARPVVRDILPQVRDTLGTIFDTVGKVAPKLVDVFQAFNDLPDWAKTSIVMGAGAAALGSKLGLTKLATKGGSSLLGMVSKSKPLPVIVVNKGWDKGVDLPDRTKGSPLVTGSAGKSAAEAAGKDARKAATASAMASRMVPLGSVLGLVYAGATSSQAPGQQKNYGNSGGPSKFFGDALGGLTSDQVSTYALGAHSIERLDGALSKLDSNAKRYSALKDFMGVAFNDHGESEWDYLNGVLPKTEAKLGDTVSAFVRQRDAAREVRDVVGRYTQTTNQAAGATSDLSRIMGAGRVDTTNLGGAVANNLSPHLADAGGKAKTLDGNLRHIPKELQSNVKVDGVTAANTQVLNLLGNMARIAAGVHGSVTVGVGVSSAPHREHGGPVKAGQGYVVGERRPEYFVPKVDGTILPKVPDMPSFDNEDWGGHVGSGEPIVVQVVLERKVLAEATFDVARDKLART